MKHIWGKYVFKNNYGHILKNNDPKTGRGICSEIENGILKNKNEQWYSSAIYSKIGPFYIQK